MIFMPESESWLKLLPLPGTSIEEVAEGFTKIIKFSHLTNFASPIRYKGMCFTANEVTIHRSYEDFAKRETDTQFIHGIIEEFKKKIQ